MLKPLKKTSTPFKYYGEKDFNYELALAREFSDSDAIAKILLYRVDYVKTQVHKVYGEAKASRKKFLTPIELNVTITVGDLTHEYLGDNGLSRQSPESVKLGVYKEELSEKNVVINKGDFFGYYDGEKERFFEIKNVSNIATNNSTLGYKPFFLTFEGVYVLRDAINEYFNN